MVPSGHRAKDPVVVSLKPKCFLPRGKCRVVNTECQDDVTGCQDLGTPQLHLFRILEFLNLKHLLSEAQNVLKQWSPKLSGTRNQFCGRQFFHGTEEGDGFRMIQAHFIYCALYCYCISSTFDHQALDPWRLGTPVLEDRKCLQSKSRGEGIYQ